MKQRKTRGKPVVSLETCYMCDKATVSREHAPPLGFFPEDRRVDLITVPSCKTHNNANSDDVRYVRDIITSSINVNEVGFRLFQEKGLPLYKKSPKLTRQTFGRTREVKINGRETAINHTDSTKFKRIIKAIACALYFNEFGEKFPYRWEIHGATMVPLYQPSVKLPDELIMMNSLLRSVPVADRHTNQPEVFRYGLVRGPEHRVIYRLVFYDGFDIYACGAPVSEEPS